MVIKNIALHAMNSFLSMEKNFQRNNLNRSFSGFKNAQQVTPKKSVCYHHPYLSPGELPSVTSATLVRARPSLDLRRLSPCDKNTTKANSATNSSDNSNYSLKNSTTINTTITSGHVSEFDPYHSSHHDVFDHRLDSMVNTLNRTEVIHQHHVDSGFYPFYQDSISTYDVMNSTSIDQDEMWPEYSRPIIWPPKVYQSASPVDMRHVTGTNMENGQFIVHGSYSSSQKVIPTWMPDESWNKNYDSIMHSNFPLEFHESSNSNQTHTNSSQQADIGKQSVSETEKIKNMINANINPEVQMQQATESTVSVMDQTKEDVKRVSYIFVDQIDRNQKELLIRASHYMRSFFFDMDWDESLGIDDCCFRRVLFKGLKREQFLKFIRYLEWGKEILKQFKEEEFTKFRKIATEYGFNNFESDYQEIVVNQTTLMDYESNVQENISSDSKLGESDSSFGKSMLKNKICVI